MKRLVLTILTLVLIVSGWLFVDAPLDEETRLWLESPEPFEYDRGRLVQLAAHELPEQLNALLLKCMAKPGGRSCLGWILDNPETASATIADDAYFELYDAILAEDRIQLNVLDSEPLDYSAGSLLIEATNAVIMRDVVKYGRVRPETIARLLPQHRRHLAQSDLLIDWIIFVATTGNLLNAATNAVQSARRGEVDLTAALAPFTLKEHSLRRALYGELRYSAELILRQPIGQLKPNHWLNVTRKAHQNIINASEKDRNSFWKTTVVPYELTLFDSTFDLIGGSEYEYFHSAYVDYLMNLRFLDVRLALVRGLAAQELPVAPGAWRWQNRETSLCLVPESDNLAVSHRESFEVCAEITGSASHGGTMVRIGGETIS